MKNKKFINRLDDADDGVGGIDDNQYETKHRNFAKPAKRYLKLKRNLKAAVAYAREQIKDPQMRQYYQDEAERLQLRNSFEAALREYLGE